MNKLGKLTQQVESTLERLLGGQPNEKSEPLELVTGILRDVEPHVEPVGGGRRRFPYTHITAVVLAPRKEDQDRYASALSDLDPRIRQRLDELACEKPVRLHVDVQFVRKPRKPWKADQRFELVFSRESGNAAAVSKATTATTAMASTPAARATHATRDSGPAVPAARIVILRGTTGKRTYSLSQPVIRLGRGEEHSDASGHTRRNDIAFLDEGDDVNRTVARAQAHVRFDPERHEFRLFDDGSSNGTRIVRDSDVIAVTPNGPRGVRVTSGDVIELGRARLRFEVEP